MNNFKELTTNSAIANALEALKIITPTPIQAAGIPKINEGIDVLLESETGSGKTLAYLIPLIDKIDFNTRKNQFIILVPTHELALQVNDVITSLAENSKENITSAVIMGDVNIKRQIDKLKEKPQFVIGSPGRILELIKLKKITAHTIKSIVIDECDKLLDKSNLEVIKAVIKTTLKDRQLIMASATITDEVIQISNTLMQNSEIVKCSGSTKINPNIEHIYIVCDRRDKILTLRKLMASLKPEKAIAFINKSEEIEELTEKLKFHGLKADSIHGTFVKNERKKAMDDFKGGKINLLISSDLSSRGLDINDVTHIFNLDLPEDTNTYVHRSGRTARGKNTGTVISIVTPREIMNIKGFGNKLKVNLTEKVLSYGELCYVAGVINTNSQGNKKKVKTTSQKNNINKINSYKKKKNNK